MNNNRVFLNISGKSTVLIAMVINVTAILCFMFLFLSKSDRDTIFEESFIQGEHLYRYENSKYLFWDGRYIYLKDTLYQYRQGVYVPTELPDYVESIIYRDGDISYIFTTQYKDNILWGLTGGDLLLYNPNTRRHQIIKLYNNKYFYSSCVHNESLFLLCNGGVMEIDLDSEQYSMIDTKPYYPVHNMLMNDEGDVFFHSNVISLNDNEFQYDVMLRERETSVLKKYELLHGIWNIESYDNGKIYYYITDFGGENLLFYESSIDGNRRIVGQWLADRDGFFSSAYDRYVDNNKIIAVPNIQYQDYRDDLSLLSASIRAEIVIANIETLTIEKKIPIRLKKSESIITSCYEKGSIYIFITNNNSLRVDRYDINDD